MHSMTGFGRGSATTELGTATIEIACVNRKQAEVVVQAGRDLATIEGRIRKNVLEKVSRGRIQVSIQIDRPAGSGSKVQVDEALAEALESAFKSISARIGRQVEASAADFMRSPGVITFDESGIDPEAAWLVIEPALEAALAQVLETRAAEGSDLAKDLSARLDTLEHIKNRIAALAPMRPQHYRETLFKRLRDAGLELDLDDERVVREIGLFADRCDISEETTRLDSHIRRFREYLSGSEPAGRSLDFLCQEIHREFNTIGSKASDADIAQNVVTAKTELEKIREQVQNIE
ncbi:YicC/YloC family endoribonuclease [Haloferula chungangensis]|uniref:YicC/YloC family endoribonuclease n=1 Tax=Haloferula chungangensis TaxID=1048331 RepID=A0ABW2L3H7_9BACT